MQAQDTPEQLWEKITSFVRISQEHVTAGGEANLSGLDEKVQQLCDAILNMSGPDAIAYEKKLIILNDSLTVLRDAMEKNQAKVRDELSSLDLRHKAARAYQISDHHVKPSKPE